MGHDIREWESRVVAQPIAQLFPLPGGTPVPAAEGSASTEVAAEWDHVWSEAGQQQDGHPETTEHDPQPGPESPHLGEPRESSGGFNPEALPSAPRQSDAETRPELREQAPQTRQLPEPGAERTNLPRSVELPPSHVGAQQRGHEGLARDSQGRAAVDHPGRTAPRQEPSGVAPAQTRDAHATRRPETPATPPRPHAAATAGRTAAIPRQAELPRLTTDEVVSRIPRQAPSVLPNASITEPSNPFHGNEVDPAEPVVRSNSPRIGEPPAEEPTQRGQTAARGGPTPSQEPTRPFEGAVPRVAGEPPVPVRIATAGSTSNETIPEARAETARPVQQPAPGVAQAEQREPSGFRAAPSPAQSAAVAQRQSETPQERTAEREESPRSTPADQPRRSVPDKPAASEPARPQGSPLPSSGAFAGLETAPTREAELRPAFLQRLAEQAPAPSQSQADKQAEPHTPNLEPEGSHRHGQQGPGEAQTEREAKQGPTRLETGWFAPRQTQRSRSLDRTPQPVERTNQDTVDEVRQVRTLPRRGLAPELSRFSLPRGGEVSHSDRFEQGTQRELRAAGPEQAAETTPDRRESSTARSSEAPAGPARASSQAQSGAATAETRVRAETPREAGEQAKVVTAPVGLRGSTPAAAATSAARAAWVATTPEQQAWIEAVVARARAVPRNGAVELRFALQPENLGTVWVRIESREDRLRIRLTASSETAADFLASSLPRLGSQLNQPGGPQTQIEIDYSDAADSSALSERREDASGSTRDRRSHAESTPQDSTALPEKQNLRLGSSLLDLTA